MAYKGFIDFLDSRNARGWAAYSTDEKYEQVSIRVVFANRRDKVIPARKFRKDLLDSGYGSGQFGFELQVPDETGFDLTEALFYFPDDTRLPLTGAALEQSERSRVIQSNERIARKLPSAEDITSLNFRSRLSSLIICRSPDKLEISAPIKKVCLYVTYSATPTVKEMHKRQVAAFQAANYFVVSVIATDTPPEDGRSPRLGDLSIVKKNVGYDFGSWWTGYQTTKDLLNDKIYDLSHVALCNDSYLGIVSDEEIQELEDRPEELVGISSSPQRGTHLQSYFVIAQNSFLKSGRFQNFISSYGFPPQKDSVIKQGELGLSAAANGPIYAKHDYYSLLSEWAEQLNEMIDEECKASSFLGLFTDPNQIQKDFMEFFDKIRFGDMVNPTHAFWRQIVKAGTNIIKTELLVKNPIRVPNWRSAIVFCMRDPAISASLSDVQRSLPTLRDQNASVLSGLLNMKANVSANRLRGTLN